MYGTILLDLRIVSINGKIYPIRENPFHFLCMGYHNGARNMDGPHHFDISLPI